MQAQPAVNPVGNPRQSAFIRQKNQQERRKKMIMDARAWFTTNREGYPPFDKGKSTSADVCPKCNKRSLIKYFTPDGTEIIRACLNRWNPMKSHRCNYSDKIPKPGKGNGKTKQDDSLAETV